MKLSLNRLICHAPNRFVPSIARWQHFLGPDQHIQYQQRFSSTATEAAQDGASSENGTVPPQETNALPQLQAEIGQAPSELKIRRLMTARGNWHPSKKEASIAEKNRQQVAAHTDGLSASQQLLAAATAAFDAAEDYVGVVVQPIPPSVSVREEHLPWCLSKEERAMSGMDRLGVEIERFYAYSKPDYSEALARRHVIEQVRNHVRTTLPDHVLEVFGSERTGLALPTSDIDLRLFMRGKFENPRLAKFPPIPRVRAEGVKSLHRLFVGNLSKHKAYLLRLLRQARYPLILLQDRQSGLEIQIVLSNDTSLSREIMKGYMEDYPYLRQLYFVVKTIFDVRGLSDVFRGGFGSYPIFMMLVASIKHMPHPRNDAAGALVNFLKFYRSFNTKKHGISIEPPYIFDKMKEFVMSHKENVKLKTGEAKPLPEFLLCIRDPADETNDLGRKGIAIKHVQATFRHLCYKLDRDLAVNTRPSQLGPLVGNSYMLNKERRARLRHYGNTLSLQLQPSLAATANMVIEREKEAEAAKLAEEANKESEEDKEKARLAREERDKEFHRLTEVRNAKLRQEAERTAVLEHGDAMASILGMPSVADEASEQSSNDAEGPMVLQPQIEETYSETQAGSSSTQYPAEKTNAAAKEGR